MKESKCDFNAEIQQLKSGFEKGQGSIDKEMKEIKEELLSQKQRINELEKSVSYWEKEFEILNADNKHF